MFYTSDSIRIITMEDKLDSVWDIVPKAGEPDAYELKLRSVHNPRAEVFPSDHPWKT
jgi:hypothetical protein